MVSSDRWWSTEKCCSLRLVRWQVVGAVGGFGFAAAVLRVAWPAAACDRVAPRECRVEDIRPGWRLGLVGGRPFGRRPSILVVRRMGGLRAGDGAKWDG